MIKEKTNLRRLLNDKLVKKFFASDFNIAKDFFATLISEVLEAPFEEIHEHLEFIPNDINSQNDVVDSRVDYALKNDHLYFNIEFSNYIDKKNIVKNNAYVYHLFLNQIPDAKKYVDLKPIIQITINSTDLFGYGAFLYHSVATEVKYNVRRPHTYIDYYDFNLAYLTKLDYNEIEEGSYLEQMLYFFTSDSKEKLDKLYGGDGIMADLEKKRDEIMENWKPFMYYEEEDILPDEVLEKREKQYEKIREEVRAEATAKGKAEGLAKGREEGLKQGRDEGLKQGRDEGLKQGRDEGLKQGRDEGLIEGRAQGLAEGIEQNKKETVIEMLKLNISFENISKVTKLSIEQIKDIQKENES